jgi:hypothetical protein
MKIARITGCEHGAATAQCQEDRAVKMKLQNEATVLNGAADVRGELPTTLDAVAAQAAVARRPCCQSR